jgi:ankyrin repeat protein
MNTKFCRLCNYPFLRLVAVTLLAVAWSGPAFCGELHDAAKKGDLEKVKALIAAGANVNAPDDDGNTPLNCAVNNWGGTAADIETQERAILALIDAGANPNAPGKYGKPANFTAARLGRLSVVKKLVEHGSDLTFKEKEKGYTPLDQAGSSEVWQYLRSKGDETGRTDFDKALCEAAKDGIPDAVDYFLKKGANINVKVDETLGEFRIQHAGGFNMPSLWVMPCHGITPLHYACFGGSEEAARILVVKGANVNTPDSDGETPLDFAIFRGYTNLVTYLSSAGAKQALGPEKMQIRSKLDNQIPNRTWNNCSVTRDFDFIKERPDIKVNNPADGKGNAITFGEEWGGWDDDDVLFRKGMVGSCKALNIYVKEGTEAKCSQKYFRFEKGNWVVVKQ